MGSKEFEKDYKIALKSFTLIHRAKNLDQENYNTMINTVYKSIISSEEQDLLCKLFSSSRPLLEKLSIGIKKFITSADRKFLLYYLSAIECSNNHDIEGVIKIFTHVTNEIHEHLSNEARFTFDLKRRDYSVYKKLNSNIRIWLQHFSYSLGIFDEISDGNVSNKTILDKINDYISTVKNKKNIRCELKTSKISHDERFFPVIFRLLDTSFSILDNFNSKNPCVEDANAFRSTLHYIQKSLQTVLSLKESIDLRVAEEDGEKYKCAYNVLRQYSKFIFTKFIYTLYIIANEIDTKYGRTSNAEYVEYEKQPVDPYYVGRDDEDELLINKISRDIRIFITHHGYMLGIGQQYFNDIINQEQETSTFLYLSKELNKVLFQECFNGINKKTLSLLLGEEKFHEGISVLDGLHTFIVDNAQTDVGAFKRASQFIVEQIGYEKKSTFATYKKYLLQLVEENILLNEKDVEKIDNELKNDTLISENVYPLKRQVLNSNNNTQDFTNVVKAVIEPIKQMIDTQNTNFQTLIKQQNEHFKTLVESIQTGTKEDEYDIVAYTKDYDIDGIVIKYNDPRIQEQIKNAFGDAFEYIDTNSTIKAKTASQYDAIGRCLNQMTDKEKYHFYIQHFDSVEVGMKIVEKIKNDNIELY